MMKLKRTTGVATLLAGVLTSGSVLAEGGAGAQGSLSFGADGAQTQGDASAGGPEASRGAALEIGLFGGVLLPSEDHNFQQEALPHQRFRKLAPELGARFGIYPWGFLGAELEAGAMPTSTADARSAGLYALRAHGVLQHSFGALTPFLLVGGGRMGGDSDAMGTDSDPLLHFGLGAKLRLDDFVGLRLDLRDNLTQKNGAADGSLTHHPEALLGLSFTFDLGGRAKATDRDGDGFADDQDKCPEQAGVAPDGCPDLDPDRDGVPLPEDKCPEQAGVAPDGCPDLDPDKDGVPLPEDKCPEQAGVAPDGCPDLDPDKDGVPLPEDKCPEQAGVAPDGCPDLDADKDGIPLPQDKCPEEPETVNNYQDEDGCPDTVPEKVKKFTGAVEGIQFATGKATITPRSFATLDQAVAVLKEYGELRVLITGHTDNVGDHDANVKLSEARASAVRDYFIKKGIAAERIDVKGMGPDQPVAGNDTPAGQAKNRRIEFKMQ